MRTARWDEVWQRILANILEVAGPLSTPCWIWQGSFGGGRSGEYPRMSLDGVTVAVHRVVFIHANGYIAPKRHVDHLCVNTRCVNPQHLEAVTALQNQRRKKRVDNLIENIHTWSVVRNGEHE